jgi:DNA-binding CsgD family transcriptional regulator
MTSTTTLLGAVTKPRFLVSSWPWRGLAYVTTTGVVWILLGIALAVPLAPLVLAVNEARGTDFWAAAALGLVGVLALALVAIGYLLKDRVADVDEFVEMLRRVAGGGTVVDPEVVRQLMLRDPLDHLSSREREVLALLAEGHSNAAIARLLTLTEAGVGKHIGNLLAKLHLPISDDTNRRVLAVLTYLRNQS